MATTPTDLAKTEELPKTEQTEQTLDSLSLTPTASLSSSGGDRKGAAEEIKGKADSLQAAFDRYQLPPNWVVIEGDFNKLIPEYSEEFVLLEWQPDATLAGAASTSSAASTTETKTESESVGQSQNAGDSKNADESRQLLRVLITRYAMESGSMLSNRDHLVIAEKEHVLDRGVTGKISLYFMLGDPNKLRSEISTHFNSRALRVGYSKNWSDFVLSKIPTRAEKRMALLEEYATYDFEGWLVGSMRLPLFREWWAELISANLFKRSGELEYFEQLCQSFGLAKPSKEETLLIKDMEVARDARRYDDTIKLLQKMSTVSRQLENKTVMRYLDDLNAPADSYWLISDQCDAALRMGQYFEKFSPRHALEAYRILLENKLSGRPIDSQFQREAEIAIARVARDIAEKSNLGVDLQKSLELNLVIINSWDTTIEEKNRLFELWIKEYIKFCALSDTSMACELLKKIHLTVHRNNTPNFGPIFMPLILSMCDKIFELKGNKLIKPDALEVKKLADVVSVTRADVLKEQDKSIELTETESKNSHDKKEQTEADLIEIVIPENWKMLGSSKDWYSSEHSQAIILSKIYPKAEQNFKDKPQLVSISFKPIKRVVDTVRKTVVHPVLGTFESEHPVYASEREEMTLTITFAQLKNSNNGHDLIDLFPELDRYLFGLMNLYYHTPEYAVPEWLLSHDNVDLEKWQLSLSLGAMREYVVDDLFQTLKNLQIFNDIEIESFKSFCHKYTISNHSPEEAVAISKIKSFVDAKKFSEAIQCAREAHEQSRKIENRHLIPNMAKFLKQTGQNRYQPTHFSDQCDIAYDLGCSLEHISLVGALQALSIVIDGKLSDVEVRSYFKRDAVETASRILRFLGTDPKGAVVDRKDFAEALLLQSRIVNNEFEVHHFTKQLKTDKIELNTMLLMLENLCGFTSSVGSEDRVFLTADVLDNNNVSYPKLLYKMATVVRELLGKNSEPQNKDSPGDTKGQMDAELSGEASSAPKPLSFDPKAPGSPRTSSRQLTNSERAVEPSAGAAGAAGAGAGSAASHRRTGSMGLTTKLILSLDED